MVEIKLSSDKIKDTIKPLDDLLNEKIVYLGNGGTDLVKVSKGKTVKVDRFDIKTENSVAHFYTTIHPHWYGDGEIEVLPKPYPEDIEDLEIFQIPNRDYWAKILNNVIVNYKIYSIVDYGLRLGSSKFFPHYSKNNYIEFELDNGSSFSIGFFENTRNENLFLNEYIWTGELGINFNHQITAKELIKWEMKRIK